MCVWAIVHSRRAVWSLNESDARGARHYLLHLAHASLRRPHARGLPACAKVALLHQPHLIEEGAPPVSKVLAAAGKALGLTVTLEAFALYSGDK